MGCCCKPEESTRFGGSFYALLHLAPPLLQGGGGRGEGSPEPNRRTEMRGSIRLQGLVGAAIIPYGLHLRKIPKKCHIAIGAACLIPLFFSIFLAVYGCIPTVSYDEDVVIVLGAGIRGERVTPTLAKRSGPSAKLQAKKPFCMNSARFEESYPTNRTGRPVRPHCLAPAFEAQSANETTEPPE